MVQVRSRLRERQGGWLYDSIGIGFRLWNRVGARIRRVIMKGGS